MAKVHVVNNRYHDFSGAAKFGEVTNITEGTVSIFKTDAVAQLLREKLKDFNAVEDFILISGPSALNMLVAMHLQKRFGTFKVLIFDAVAQEYVVRHFKSL